MKNKIKAGGFPKLFVVILSAVAGTVAGNMIFSRHTDANNPAFAENNKVHEYFYDAQGRARVDIGMYNGQPVHEYWSEGSDNSIRFQLGTYGSDVREKASGAFS